MREVIGFFVIAAMMAEMLHLPEKEPQPLPIQLRVSTGALSTRKVLRLWSVSREGPVEL